MSRSRPRLHHLSRWSEFWGPLQTPSGALAFSDEILALALRLRDEQRLPAMPGKNRRERRALHRAALFCLNAELGRDAWPARLRKQWARVFGPRWATTEKGRGVRELAAVLGVKPGEVRGMVEDQ